MPELPEVEAVARRLRREATGAVIQRVKVLRDRATHPQRPEELNGAAGYTIDRMTMIDLFPQTFHLETVVRMSLK